MPKFRHLLISLLVAFTAACETLPVENPSRWQDGALAVVPYQMAPDSLFRLDVSINGSEPLPFVIDTGASISILFENTITALDLPLIPGAITTVHGLSAKSDVPLANISTFQLGRMTETNVPVAILENRIITTNQPAGIIGMDILKNYALVFDRENSQLIFLPPSRFDARNFSRWDKLPLQKNPFASEDFGLLFLDIQIGRNTTPAVFDLGSSITMVNWAVAESAPVLKRYRRRLRQQWEIEGAIGTFRPQILVTYEKLMAGRYIWNNRNVFVTDLDTLNVIGTENRPLIIAGSDLFRETNFAVNFKTQELFVKRSEAYQLKDPRRTGSRVDSDLAVIEVSR